MTKPRKQIDYPPEFEEAWKVYPLRKGKLKASEAYEKVPPWIRNETILEAIRCYAASPTVQKYIKAGTPEFILHFATWLNQARWEDEPEPGTQQRQPLGECMSEKCSVAVWRVLCCHFLTKTLADEQWLQFRDYVTKNRHGEFRFQGVLGFGGKFHFRWPHEMWVACDLEDETPEGHDGICAANQQLRSFVETWAEGAS